MRWSATRGERGWRASAAWVGPGLFFAVLATFSPLLWAGYINFDDPVYVVQNARVLAGLTWENVRWAFTTLHWFYYPLTWLSHMLDTDLFGAWAGGRHLTNILLHAAASVLLYAFLRRATGAPWRSAAVAALFALHPLRVESVAWISERKDVLSAALFMAMLVLYARYVERPSPARYAAVAALFVAALMAKSTVVMAPCVLLLLDYWPLGRLGAWTPWGQESRSPAGASRVWRLVLEKVPMLLLAACFSFLTLAGQRGAMDPAGAHLSWDRILVASSNYGGFLAKAAVPVGLAIVYPQMPGEALLRNGLLGAGLLVLGTLLALGLGRKYPYGPVGWLWYLIYMLPVAGLVQVGAQPTTDRAAYVPMVGIFIVVVWGLGDLVESRPAFRPAVAVACASVLVLLAVQTHLACRYWRDGVTLFARAATVVPGNYQAFSLLGQALEDRGDLPAAEAALREATRLAPWYAEAWGNLANLLARQGRADEAETCYARVLALSPGDPKAANNLGMLLESRGQLQKAEPLYRRALAADAAYLNARVNLSRVLLGEGRVEEAREQARLALRQDPYSDRARQAVAAAEQDRSVPGAKP